MAILTANMFGVKHNRQSGTKVGNYKRSPTFPKLSWTLAYKRRK